MKLKNILLGLIIASSALMADYEIIETRTDSYDQSMVVSEKEVFFGELSQYNDYLTEIRNKAAEGVLSGLSVGAESLAKGLFKSGAQGAGAGLGIGLIYGALDPFVMSFYSDQFYLRVDSIELSDGTKELKSYFFIGNKNPSYSKDQIKTLIGESK